MGLIDTIGSLITTPMVNSSNQRIANRTNSFNAQQADLNRQFQSQEAQIAREWQEEQYIKYSSPKAMVSQYEDAGLNPALMYGQNLQSSTGSSPSPSGSAATGTAISNQAPQFMNVVEDILALKKLDTEIDLMKSQAEGNRAAAAKSSSDILLNSQSIRESQQRISKLIAETKNEDEKRGLIIAQKLLTEKDSQLKSNQSISLSFDNLEKQWRQEFKEKYGAYPAENAYQAVQKFFDALDNKFNILSIFKR